MESQISHGSGFIVALGHISWTGRQYVRGGLVVTRNWCKGESEKHLNSPCAPETDEGENSQFKEWILKAVCPKQGLVKYYSSKIKWTEM